MNQPPSENWRYPEIPHSIDHAGAASYAVANSMDAFEKSHRLGATFWEVDVRLSADGVLCAHHDATMDDGRAIADLDYDSIHHHCGAITLQQIIDRALTLDMGIYVDLKCPNALVPCFNMLRDNHMEKVVFGLWPDTDDRDSIATLKSLDCPYPIAILVPLGANPFVNTEQADMVHLCWEHMDNVFETVNQDLFDAFAKRNQQVVAWHDECPKRMQKLRALPFWGICSGSPEMVRPINRVLADNPTWEPTVVCHRGLNTVAPENSIPALKAAFGIGFHTVELDVHVTSDGQLVVFHDYTMERTANGKPYDVICNKSFADIQSYDGGGWFSDFYKDMKIPTLQDFLDVTKLYDGHLYVELKSAPADLVVQAVQQAGMMDKCFFWSFCAYSLVQLRKMAPDANIMTRRQDFATVDEALDFVGANIIEYAVGDDWSEIATLNKQGINSMIAYNGNDGDVFKRIAHARPSMINLHCPLEFVDYIQKR